MGKLSTAVSQEHKKILSQERCHSITKEILLALPEMLQIEPNYRWPATKARDHFKQILYRADMAIAKRNRDSQAGEAPDRQVTTPSRSPTAKSDASSPLLPHKNPQLSIAKDGSQQDSPVEASPKFDEELTHTPRHMTMNSDTNVGGVGSLGIALDYLDGTTQTCHSGKLNPRVLSDRIGRVSGMKEPNSKNKPSTRMFPFQDAAQVSPSHPQSPQMYMSLRNRETRSTPNPSAAATADHTDPEDRPPSAHNQEIATVPEPSMPPTPPARLSFRDALKWRMNAKTQRSAVELPNNHLLRFLEGRDHVSSEPVSYPGQGSMLIERLGIRG